MNSTHPWAQGFQSYSRPFLCCCVNHLSWTELYNHQCLCACCRSSLWHNLKEVCDAQKAFTWCKYTRATRGSCFVVTLVAMWPWVYILICFSHITPVVSLILLVYLLTSDFQNSKPTFEKEPTILVKFSSTAVDSQSQCVCQLSYSLNYNSLAITDGFFLPEFTKIYLYLSKNAVKKHHNTRKSLTWHASVLDSCDTILSSCLSVSMGKC